ncbi:MAG: hypothetical protein R3C10_23830 [Pirellulales bacterium]
MHNEQLRQQGHPVQVRHVNSGGAAEFTSMMTVARSDVDSATTSAVRTALEQNDIAQATQLVQRAQHIPQLTPEQQGLVADKLRRSVPEPQVTPGMQQAVVSGDASFYHIYLFDCCDEDGDIVEVMLDGVPFAVVPITNSGATLSVPIVNGASTTISLRGVHDGIGGITVACRTSQGDFFLSCMLEGEVQVVGVTP